VVVEVLEELEKGEKGKKEVLDDIKCKGDK